MSHSEDILIRQTHLSPERRALLELWKRGQQVEVADTQKIVPRREKSPVPLSFEQQRLWFLDQLEPGNPFYNVYMALSLSGPLNVKALQQSLDVLVQRHESLRTAFDIKDGQPVQVIEPLCRCILTIVELSVLRPLLRQEEIQRLAREDARIPFDLVHSPLCRATLVRVDKNNDEHVLLLTMHHIITDGWSTGILMRELAICYNAFIVDQVPSLPDLPIQYADYALWQRQRLQGEELAKQRRYWQGRLAAMPGTLELPTDYPRPTVQHYDGALEIVQLPLLLSEALQRFSEREGVTLFTTLLAAFQVLLARYTGQDDIVIGTDSTHRSSVETEGVIGFFVNNLVIRGNLSGNPTFREFLKRMQEATLEDFAHRDMPFDVLVADLQPDRHLSRSTLVQVMFSLQDTSITEVP